MKEETLKEAAEKYFDYNIFCDSITDFEKEISIRSYIAGAKWQAERMYSEEDLKEAYKSCYTPLSFGKIGDLDEDFKEWFEQYKKENKQ